jgi:integrase
MVQILASIQSHVGGVAGDPGLTFAEFAPKYLAKLTSKKLQALDRPTTILHRHLVPFFGLRPLRSLKLEDGIAYIAHRRAQDAADGTIERECGVLIGLLNYAVANEDLDKNRLLSLDVPSGVKRTRVAEAWELFRVYHAAAPAIQRVMMLALLTTLREAKIISIHHEWLIQRGDGEWLIPAPGSRLKGVPKELPLSSLAGFFLKGTQPRIGGRYFSQWKDANSFKHRWIEACVRAGVQDLHFHDLRHTAATWLGEAGVEYATIEKLLGHRLSGMGEQYIHDWKTKLRAAVTKLEEVVRERFKAASQDERVRTVGSYGQLVDSCKNEQLPKWWLYGAEGQNRTVDTSLFRMDGK